MKSYGRSRKGAWIEISMNRTRPKQIVVAPARERGLKSNTMKEVREVGQVAPARERGLKLYLYRGGSVAHCRSRKGAWIEIYRMENPYL